MAAKKHLENDTKFKNSTLSAAERKRRSRVRQQIIRSELENCGIKIRSFPIDEHLYEGFERLASGSPEGMGVNELMFISMRDFLSKHLNESYKSHQYLLDLATMNAQLKIKGKGFGTLRPWGQES